MTSVVTASCLAVVIGATAANGWAGGDTPPTKTLVGGATDLNYPRGLALDSAGRMYVANVVGDTVTIYAADWADGNTAPVDQITGMTGGTRGVTFDSAGNLYVTTFNSNYSVYVFAPGASGAATPIKVLNGASTGLNRPTGVRIDAAGNMYVANAGSGTPTVTAYAAGWASGDTAPTKTLVGASTGLAEPTGILFDEEQRMYVTNDDADSVTVYAPNWANGNTAPVKTLQGASTGLDEPFWLTFDSSDRMYATNAGNDSVTVYAADWAGGNTAPLKTLVGASTGLDSPRGIDFNDLGDMFVANGNNDSVTVYPSSYQTITFPPLPNTKYSATPPVPAATASSGLAVSYRSLTPRVCSATSGGTISFVSTGTCRIAANQAGDVTWNPAPQVTRSFAVQKTPLPLRVSARPATSPVKRVGSTTVVFSATTSPRGKVRTTVFCGPVTRGDLRFCSYEVGPRGRVTVTTNGVANVRVRVTIRAWPRPGSARTMNPSSVFTRTWWVS